jgi:hypothetical protein
LPGQYFFDFDVWSDQGDGDHINEAVQFEITSSFEAAEIDAQKLRGAIVPSATVCNLD